MPKDTFELEMTMPSFNHVGEATVKDLSTAIDVYSHAGHDLIPLKGKAPIHKGWRTRSYSRDELNHHVKRGGNLGVRLGENDLVLDIDPRNFPEGCDPVAELQEKIGIKLGDWPYTVTGSGGLHVYMRLPTGGKVQNGIEGFEGIEFKAAGRQVVAPGSTHPDTGEIYALYDPFDLLSEPDPAPDALLNLVVRRPAPPRDTEEGLLDSEQVRHILDAADPILFREYEREWLPMIMCIHGLSGGDAIEEAIEWSERDPEHVGDARAAIEARWNGFGNVHENAERVGWGTFQVLLERCPEALERARLAVRGDPRDDFDDLDQDDLDQDRDCKPVIIQQPGNLVEIVEKAEQALLDHDPDGILQRGQELVRPARLDADQSEDGISRRKGSTVLLPVVKAWLRLQMADAAKWKSPRGKAQNKTFSSADPHASYADALLAKAGSWNFPAIRALVTAPTFDVATGRPIDRPGHDRITGVLAVFDPDVFPETRRGIGKDGAKKALDRVYYMLLRDFPFTDGPSASVALSAMLTGLLRPTMRSAPAHCFDAPTAGTGKSKLADIASILITGAPAPAMSWGKNDEETEKRVIAALRRGDQILLMDNLESPQEVTGDFLASILTQDTYQARILGHSEVLTLPTRILFMATGNNLVVRGDTCRRVVKCRIDARSEHPEERKFDFDPLKTASDKRGEIIADLLSAVQAYFDADRPADPPHLGSFEDWTVIRGLLLWCGYADPAATMQEIREVDPAREGILETLEAWYETHGDRWLEVKQLEPAEFDDNSQTRDDLWELIIDNLADGNATTQWIGRKLASKRDTVAGPFTLCVDPSGRVKKFRVVHQDQ